MTTGTTTERKTRKKNKPADPAVAEMNVDAAAGGPPSTASTEAVTLSAELATYGFEVPPALIDQWDPTTLDTISRTSKRWTEEFDRALTDEPVPAEDRTPVPPLLQGMEAMSPEVAKHATTMGTDWANCLNRVILNPYPTESGIAKVWQESYDAARAAKVTSPAEGTQAAATTESGTSQPLTNAESAEQLAAKRKAEADADRARQQQLAIESAQHDMEEAVTHQEELAEQIVDMKAEMKELKSAYDNAVVRGQKAAKALRRARAGQFERTLPFRNESKPASLEVPDQDIGGQAAVASPPKVDEGAFISLNYLAKGELQEFIPGTPEDRGISAKQVEKLIEAIGGDTIGKLEEFQKSKGSWWTKEISGFGAETITKLQDAHEVIRRKFPVPDPDEVEEPVAAAPAVETMSPIVAIKRLSALTIRCEAVMDECESDNGIDFLSDVGKEATSMKATIEEQQRVSPAQESAIINWEAGVEKWSNGQPAPEVDDNDETGFGGGVIEDDEDELEVDDEDANDNDE